MSRELQSDIVSSVDRSSSGIADEQLESQLLHPENPSASSVAMTSDAVSPTAETNITDDADVDERGTVSNGTSYPTHQSDTSIGVSIVWVVSDLIVFSTSAKEQIVLLLPRFVLLLVALSRAL